MDPDLAGLDTAGFAVLRGLLPPDRCAELAVLFDEAGRFRSTVDMARHRYGEGRYRYFAEPLPAIVAGLRRDLYPPLARLANRWGPRLDRQAFQPFPADHDAYRARCAAAGQTLPTPLLLRYGPGGWNALHQDIYGPEAFPLQVAVMLSAAGDYEGGEFLLVEQRPRAQSRGSAIRLEQGDAVVFPTRYRPVSSAAGSTRLTVRHGVSTVTAGQRVTLGIIFHDAV